MSAPVFVLPTEALRAGEHLRLDGAEGRHAAVVRRIGAGELVDLTDGRGLLAHCVVTGADKTGLALTVTARETVPAPTPRLIVVQALAKGDRGELAVEMLTEVGVDEIVPWSAARSIVQWKGERAQKSLGRWASTAHEAAKQSRRTYFPVVTPLASTWQVADRLAAAALALVLHEEAQEPLGAYAVPSAGDVVLVVGPEGGISPEELQVFEAAGAHPALLGPTVLRTSTAGVVAAGALLSGSPRWS